MIYDSAVRSTYEETAGATGTGYETLEAHAQGSHQAAGRRPAYRVLVVEDDPHIGRLLLVNLNRAGLDARLALDGQAGLESFRDHPPHLVLLDLMMPVMDGFQVCEKIRAESQVPIVIMTARLEPVHRMRGFRLGADDYVLKPFDPQLLVARLIAHLRRVYRYDNGHIRRKDTPDEEEAASVMVVKDSPMSAEVSMAPKAAAILAHLPAGWAACAACHFMAPPSQFPRRFTTPQSATVVCPNCGETGQIQLAAK